MIDPIVAGILGSALVVVLLLLGMPIAFLMMFVGFIAIWALTSLGAALPVVAKTIYEVAANYPYTIIPLFHPYGRICRQRRHHKRALRDI